MMIPRDLVRAHQNAVAALGSDEQHDAAGKAVWSEVVRWIWELEIPEVLPGMLPPMSEIVRIENDSRQAISTMLLGVLDGQPLPTLKPIQVLLVHCRIAWVSHLVALGKRSDFGPGCSSPELLRLALIELWEAGGFITLWSNVATVCSNAALPGRRA